MGSGAACAGRATWAASGPTATPESGCAKATWTRTSTRTLRARGRPAIPAYQNANTSNVFAEGRLFVSDRLALIGGATWGTAGRDYTGVRVPGVASTFNLRAKKDYDWVAPRIGLLWEGDDGVRVSPTSPSRWSHRNLRQR